MTILGVICSLAGTCLMFTLGGFVYIRFKIARPPPYVPPPLPVFPRDNELHPIKDLPHVGCWPQIRQTLVEIAALSGQIKLEDSKSAVELKDFPLVEHDMGVEEKHRRDLYSYLGFTHEALIPWTYDLIPSLTRLVKPTVLLHHLLSRKEAMRRSLIKRLQGKPSALRPPVS